MRAQHVEIRKARADDLYALARSLGQWGFLIDRFDRQQAGLGELITAWSPAGRALGAVYLWLEQAEEPEIRDHLPDVPLLTHLEVAEPHRNRLVGTMLVTATEQKALAFGHTRLALAVWLGNPDAERLYQRLGYARWAHGQVHCEDKFGDRNVEICNVLVKRLADWNQRSSPCHEGILAHR
jgi:GNAT superfamily N-acetyltransferase